MTKHLIRVTLFAAAVAGLLVACVSAPGPAPESTRAWLAGDHHIHSRYSVGWDQEQDPPAPIVGGDAIYPIPMNALMARNFGLSWMVATDHGGPNHSKINMEMAYPEMVQSRLVVPEVIQFVGLELNSPGADHSSTIIPHSHDEAAQLFELESRFDRLEEFPLNPARENPSLMLEALQVMNGMQRKPVVIAHHPSRSAEAMGVYGLYEPAEIRDWNDTAPNIAVGMEGAPGHQALALAKNGSVTRDAPRGGYGRFPSMGGFDQMTARLGGFWDSLLAEGRRWWITSNSDSHVHYTEGGADFWPGEYSKTYVYADKDYQDILDGIRNGRVFVTLGDLISGLFVSVEAGEQQAAIGGELELPRGTDIRVTIRFLDPEGNNHRGENPEVQRVDLIMGNVTGPSQDRSLDINATTRVVKRFSAADWRRAGQWRVMTHSINDLDGPAYIRVRGTNTDELEPAEDSRLEDPWSDLWFYSNPVFISTH